MALLQRTYRGSGKESIPPDWFDKTAHTHIALDDALEQGSLFCNMLRFNKSRSFA